MNTEIFETFWAITDDALQRCMAQIRAQSPEQMDQLRAMYCNEELERLHGRVLTDAAVPVARHGGGNGTGGAVAVIHIHGPITQRNSLMSMIFGGTSTLGISAALRQALADPDVGSILLDIDSPGGTVSGVPELAAEILAARGSKSIVAVANSFAASAAYWIASAADEIVVTPSGEVGSIGVVAVHMEQSRRLEKEGITPTIMRAPANKFGGNPFEPLSEETRDHIQSQVDEFHAMFVAAVAKGRGVGVGQVRGGFGQGRVVLAKEAVKLGMADRVATIEQTVARMMGGRRGGMRAVASPPGPLSRGEGEHGGIAISDNLSHSDGTGGAPSNDAAKEEPPETKFEASKETPSDSVGLDLRQRRHRAHARGLPAAG